MLIITLFQFRESPSWKVAEFLSQLSRKSVAGSGDEQVGWYTSECAVLPNPIYMYLHYLNIIVLDDVILGH